MLVEEIPALKLKSDRKTCLFSVFTNMLIKRIFCGICQLASQPVGYKKNTYWMPKLRLWKIVFWVPLLLPCCAADWTWCAVVFISKNLLTKIFHTCTLNFLQVPLSTSDALDIYFLSVSECQSNISLLDVRGVAVPGIGTVWLKS